MDQGGNTGRRTAPKTEEQGSGTARTRKSLAVYRAGVRSPAPGPITGEPARQGEDGFADGFTGILALQNLESFDEQAVGEVLGRVAHLIAWAQAQQARVLNRMETVFREDYAAATERLDPGMAFSLAAAECAAILQIPHGTAQRLMFDAGLLTDTHKATLDALQDGNLSYRHAEVVLDQCDSVPDADLPEFEAALLAAAAGQTRAQFSAKARRLRETKYPQTIPVRHQSAFEKRRVTLDREEDGMSCLSAHLRAAEAQQIYTALSTAARGEQTDGDPRTRDQLRADILAQLLMGGLGGPRGGDGAGGVRVARGSRQGAGRGADTGRGGDAARRGADSGPCDTNDTATPADADSHSDACSDANAGADTGSDSESFGVLPRAEIMVLINAETLFGADEQPAELHGYGPISAEEARRLARSAVRWTGLVRNPDTGEILGVGRRRKVPAGLARWLRARDGTCRFPGCRVSTALSEVDHTTDWADGGSTDHGNLSHLCRRHHRFKTLGFWKASQPTPGVMEWTSPTGRVYRTEPYLELDLDLNLDLEVDLAPPQGTRA